MSKFANILMLSLEHSTPRTIIPIKSKYKTIAKIYSKVVSQNTINKQMMARMTVKGNSCKNIV